MDLSNRPHWSVVSIWNQKLHTFNNAQHYSIQFDSIMALMGDGKCRKANQTEAEIDLKGVGCVKQHHMLSALQTPKHVR